MSRNNFNQKKSALFTQITYLRDGAKTQARFASHLTPSQVERVMLFERKTPKRLILKTEHLYN